MLNVNILYTQYFRYIWNTLCITQTRSLQSAGHCYFSSSSDDSNDLPTPDEDSSRDPFFSSEDNTDSKSYNPLCFDLIL